MGDCIMPREGVFARVLCEGVIRVGDEMAVEARQGVRPWQSAVIHLAVPAPCVGVAFNPPTHDKAAASHILFLRPPLRADAYRDDFSHAILQSRSSYFSP